MPVLIACSGTCCWVWALCALWALWAGDWPSSPSHWTLLGPGSLARLGAGACEESTLNHCRLADLSYLHGIFVRPPAIDKGLQMPAIAHTTSTAFVVFSQYTALYGHLVRRTLADCASMLTLPFVSAVGCLAGKPASPRNSRPVASGSEELLP